MLLQHALTRVLSAQFSGLEISADGRVNKDSLLKYMSTDSDFEPTTTQRLFMRLRTSNRLGAPLG